MTPNGLARLAFWAKNMVGIQNARMEWPGFSYSETEWARLRALAPAVETTTYQKYVFVNAAIFIAIAAAGIFGVFLPLATLLFPVPAETSALKFSLLLAGCCFLIIGIGLPISLSVATWLCTDQAMQSRLTGASEDEAIAVKVSWQINRIMLVMCGLLVPGMLLFIAYDLHAGPFITALKWIAIVLMVVSVAAGARRQSKK